METFAVAAPDAADAATVLTVLPPPTPPPLPLSALVSPFGRLLEELLVSEVSRLSMERGRWKTGSGAITTSGSFGHKYTYTYRPIALSYYQTATGNAKKVDRLV